MILFNSSTRCLISLVPADSKRSQPNASTVKLAVQVPYTIASFIAEKSVRLREASRPIKLRQMSRLLGRVTQFGNGVGRQGKRSVLVKKNGSMFAFFDDHSLRAKFPKFLTGKDDVGFFESVPLLRYR